MITQTTSSCIGAFYVIACKKYGRRYIANCIDSDSEGRPKRMRIQSDIFHQGEVLFPSEYDIIEKNPTVEE